MDKKVLNQKLCKLLNPVYVNAVADQATIDSSPEYANYLNSQHPQAISMVRKFARNAFHTKDRWYNILATSSYNSKVFGLFFNYIIVEVFDRTMQPVYPKNQQVDFNYITWETATRDIEKQKREGIRPQTFIIFMRPYSLNKPVEVNYVVGKTGDFHLAKNAGKPYETYRGKIDGLFSLRAQECIRLTKDDLARILEVQQELNLACYTNKFPTIKDLLKSQKIKLSKYSRNMETTTKKTWK